MSRKKLNQAIQVALVEDDPNLRTNLAAMLNGSPGFHCQAAYPDGPTALRGIPSQRPDVVLMDINMPGMLGTECVRQLRDKVPDLPVLMLTVYDDSDQIFKSLMAGATGYLLKRSSKDKLLEAIREVDEGGAAMSGEIARRVVHFFQRLKELPANIPKSEELNSLTERETEVLAALAKGYTCKEIGDKLNIGYGTVRTHMRTIYSKLHVNTRTEAVLKYLWQ